MRPQAHIAGPVGTVFKVVVQLGWEWVGPFTLRRAHRPTLSLAGTRRQRFQHEVRAGVKLALLMPLAGGRLHPLSTEPPQGKPLKDRRRKDMVGIGGGIGYAATTKLLRAGPYRLRGEEAILSLWEKGLVRSIIACSARSLQNLFFIGHAKSPCCDLCGAPTVAGTQRILWECPAGDGAWQPFLQASRRLQFNPNSEGWEGRNALKRSWICPEPPDVFVPIWDLYRTREHVDQPLPADTTGDGEWRDLEGCLRDHLDRLALHQSERHFCGTVCAIFAGPDHAGNHLFELPGEEQTPPRAELRTLVAAVERAWCKQEYATGCEMVVTGMQALLEGVGISTWQHANLWCRVAEQVQSKPDAFFKVRKGEAHGSQQDVDEGRTLGGGAPIGSER